MNAPLADVALVFALLALFTSGFALGATLIVYRILMNWGDQIADYVEDPHEEEYERATGREPA